jgi:beta-lactam-binding protein with PASTA domain
VSTTAPATSAPPTTPAEPTTAPATTAVALVAVPPLAGLDESIARDILDDLGLGARTETRESNERPAGTVIETDPGAGEQVPVGEVITLIIATEPPPTAPPTTEPPATESPGTGPSE